MGLMGGMGMMGLMGLMGLLGGMKAPVSSFDEAGALIVVGNK